MTSHETFQSRPPDGSWIVAIHTSTNDRTPIGSGVIVDRQRILTCAHVVMDSAQMTTNDELWVAFPKASVPASLRRRVRAADICPSASTTDAAILTLEQPVPAGVTAAPIRLVTSKDLVGRRWWAFGFPRGHPFGSATEGIIDASLSYGWLRLMTDNPYPLAQGFSGAGIWCDEYQAVVGLAGQADDTNGNGLAINLSQIDEEFPNQQLKKLMTWTVAAADEAAQSAWGWSLASDPEAGRHWRPRARGVSVDSENGYRYRGRRTALTTIVNWLDRSASDRRILIVTGSPGVGKSAVLGRIITTADREIRACLPPEDDGVRAFPGSIACAVHAKGKTALDVALEIARAASARLPERVEDLPGFLKQRLAEPHTDERFAVVLDALDEAVDPAQSRLIVTSILLPLAATCADVGVRVVVGTRRRDDGGDLLAVFAGAQTLIDLDLPEFFDEADLVAYAHASLQVVGDERPGSPYADDAVAAPISARIASIAQGNFLAAGLLARTHGLYDATPVGLGELSFDASVEIALDQYLDQIMPVGTVHARHALTTLAFAEAPGLPIDLWQTALSAFDVRVGREDLARFARSSAANFLIESSGDAGYRNYRLFHQALDDTLLHSRAELADRVTDECVITRALIDDARRRGWASAHAYQLRSLSVHAAKAGLLDELLLDDEYLAHADLRRLLSVADRAQTSAGKSRARLLQLTPQAVQAKPMERLSMLNLTHALERIGPGIEVAPGLPYEARWATTAPRIERAFLEGHEGTVDAVCTLDRYGRTILASAGTDSAVRLWDPVTGQAELLLEGHSGAVHRVCALPVHDSQTLLVSAGSDNTVRIWDPVTGQCGSVLEGHDNTIRSLCVLPRAGQASLLASGDVGGSILLWDSSSGDLLHRLTGHVGPVLDLCAVATASDSILSSAGLDGTIRLWAPRTGEPGRVLLGHRAAVRSICQCRLDADCVLLASGGDDRVIELWDPHTGVARSSLRGHSGAIFGLCNVPANNGSELLLSVSNDDRTMRLWNPATGSAEWTIQSGATTWICAVCAVPMSSGQSLVASVSNTDRLVRLWDPAARRSAPLDHNSSDGMSDMHILKADDGKTYVAGRSASELRGWDILSGDLAFQARIGSAVGDVVFATTRQGIVAAHCSGSSRDIAIFDPLTGRVIRRLDDKSGTSGVRKWMRNLAVVPISGDRDLIASYGGGDDKLRLWNPDTGRAEQMWSVDSSLRWISAFSTHDGRKLLLCKTGSLGSMLLLDPLTGASAGTLNVYAAGEQYCCVYVDGDRTLLAIPDTHNDVVLIDIATGTVERTLTGHPALVSGICAAPMTSSGAMVFTASERTVRLWSPFTATCLLSIPVHHRVVECAYASGLLIVRLDAGLLAIRVNDLMDRVGR